MNKKHAIFFSSFFFFNFILFHFSFYLFTRPILSRKPRRNRTKIEENLKIPTSEFYIRDLFVVVVFLLFFFVVNSLDLCLRWTVSDIFLYTVSLIWNIIKWKWKPLANFIYIIHVYGFSGFLWRKSQIKNYTLFPIFFVNEFTCIVDPSQIIALVRILVS